MIRTSLQTIEQFKTVLLELPQHFYSKSCDALSGATIGEHTRHIVELYQCLLNGYDNSEVSYDSRKRDKRIEQDIHFAVEELYSIQKSLEQPNKNITVTYKLAGNETKLDSNYFREVMYNLEHTIHHLALIKVAITQFTDLALPDSFGVAPSTMQYRSQCAQ